MQYVIKKVTTETFAVDAEDAAAAKAATGTMISHDERTTVEPRGVTSGGSGPARPVVTHGAGKAPVAPHPASVS